MLRMISDEDVHDDIIRGLRRREPSLDIVRALDVDLEQTSAQPMPGVLALLENIGVSRVIEDILLVALCPAPEEIKDRVLFIPF